jgi:LacI family gluconate utilization system Gnt-I transcriptional repressor
VGFSNADATAAMVHHLHARGYRRIAFVGGVAGRDARGDDRRRGYARAIQALGLPEGRVFSLGKAPVPMAQGTEAVALVLRQWPEVDAIVFVSDPPAFGALMECQRRGWAVPGRIAIAGFGDFEVGKACHPRLTTVAVDNEHIGRRAGELLLRAVAAARSGQRLASETVSIPYRIEQREST